MKPTRQTSRKVLATLAAVACAFVFAALIVPAATTVAPNQRAAAARLDLSPRVFLPLLHSSGCTNIPGESYSSAAVPPPPADRPAEQHADLNLALRGYAQTTATLGLVDYNGAADPNAPQLNTLFADNRVPAFPNVYQVYDWDWNCNCRAGLITDWAVTLAGMGVAPEEPIRVPQSGYNIGYKPLPAERVLLDQPQDDPNAFEVLVLYAAPERITLKYTREDNVVEGYTIHVEKVCVAPDLLSLYTTLNAGGRSRLPALRAGQAFGRARGAEIGVAIRDAGSFLDPRSRKDWWQDVP